MSDAHKRDLRLLFLIACFVAWVFLAFINGSFEPAPERDAQEDTVFLYYGEEGETLPAPAVAATEFHVAQTALHDTDYFGTYAAGSGGRSGVWIGARTAELARTYALAKCGEGCAIVAERVPLHRDPTRTEPVLTRAMAQNIAVRLSAAARNTIAVGGANAWGHSGRLGHRAGGRQEMRRIATQDCEARRALEATPTAEISPPCRYLFLTKIIDLRPLPATYPAPYAMGLTELSPVDATQLVRRPNTPRDPFFFAHLPVKAPWCTGRYRRRSR